MEQPRADDVREAMRRLRGEMLVQMQLMDGAQVGSLGKAIRTVRYALIYALEQGVFEEGADGG